MMILYIFLILYSEYYDCAYKSTSIYEAPTIKK